MHRRFLAPWLLLWAATAQAQTQSSVYRCGKTYQAEPCAGGRAVDTRAALSAGANTRTETIYLCKHYQGHHFWSSQNCYAQGQSTVLRTVEVSRQLAWEEKVRLAEGRHSQAEALQAAPVRSVAAAGGASSGSPSSPGACEGYRNALQQNESAARAGGTAAWMNQLAEGRRQLLAQQAAAGCR